MISDYDPNDHHKLQGDLSRLYRWPKENNMNAASKVPSKSVWKTVPKSDDYQTPELSDELLRYIERTSLVKFSNEDGIKQLQDAIEFASQIGDVDTDGVEPLYSLHETEVAYLREDEVTEGDRREELLSQAAISVEELYFSAPPGNVPLDQTGDLGKTK
ncbi:GATC [Bugula neritina]|uniref:Glutamyl-tRNA(Gln) amidotransferase subunit C, mitochondrial n=1 Tax=Bugula neritina TaxID=10212 RepID=A0A7J7JLV0_BUGNE|nr:GATC [Bugula neritina]